jgi:hypothetical protein
MICVRCDKSFSCEYGLKYHIDHDVCTKNQIKCSSCGKEFTSKAGLNYHTEHNVCNVNTILTTNTKIVIKLKSNDVRAKIIASTVREGNIQPEHVVDNSKKKATIPTIIKASIWNKYIGNIIFGKCYCCGISEITPFTFEAGHVLAESHGGAITIDNLRPICVSCNRSMGTKNMRDFARVFYSDSPILLVK